MTDSEKKLRFAQRFTLTGCLLLLFISLVGYYLFCAELQRERLSLIGSISHQNPELAETLADSMFTLRPSDSLADTGANFLNSSGYSVQGSSYLYATANAPYRMLLSVLCLLLVLCLFFILITLHPWRRWCGAMISDADCLEKELHRTKQQLEGTQRTLLDRNKQIQAFIENISHQIKTPLSCVSVALDYALDTHSLSELEPAFTYLDKIKQLLSMLLTLARLEAGKILFSYEDIPITDLLAELAATSEANGVPCSFTADTSTESLRLHLDAEWIAEAITNIMEDCALHRMSDTPLYLDLTKNQEAVILTIGNKGSGICEEDLPHIFDRFYTADKPSYRHTGIGLNLSRLIVEQHHGSLIARNNAENGRTEFLLVFPNSTLKNKFPL